MLPQGIFVIIVLISKRVIDIVAREKAWVSKSTQPCLRCMTSLMTGGCVHLLYNSSWKFHHLAAGLLLARGNRYGTEKAGGTARPSRTKSHLPGHFPLASQAGCRVGPALFAFGLIAWDNVLSAPSPASMGRNNYLTPLLTSSVPLSFLSCKVLHSSYRGLILGRNWDKSLPPSLLFTVTSTSGFYSPLGLPPPLRRLKLVCNVNIVYKNLKSENSQNYAQKP